MDAPDQLHNDDVERELAERLAHLTPDDLEAALIEALDLLTLEERRALLAQAAAALERAGSHEDAALLRAGLRLLPDV